MTIILDGSKGISIPDGTAAEPSIRGVNSNTGIFYVNNDISFASDGIERLRIAANGNLTSNGSFTVTGNLVTNGSFTVNGSFSVPGISINTVNSIQGGGALTGNLSISLVGDASSPGANKIYGTNSSGQRGWQDAPTPALNLFLAGVI